MPPSEGLAAVTDSNAKAWGAASLVAALGALLFLGPYLLIFSESEPSASAAWVPFAMGLPAGYFLARFGLTRSLHPFTAALAYSTWPILFAAFFLVRALYGYAASAPFPVEELETVAALQLVPILFTPALLGFWLGSRVAA